jgi:hypothetical protein
MKHTPGPWQTRIDRYEERIDIQALDNGVPGYTVASAWGGGDEMARDIKANAHLIAAAPELLEALEALRKELRQHVKFDVKKNFSLMAADAMAGTAIHKARGES